MDDVELFNLDNLEKNHWWYKIRKKMLLDAVSVLPKGSKILDLGSATGGNVLLLKSMGFEVTSVEYSNFGIERQREKGIVAFQADARNLPFDSNIFDCVVCLDVLEHIEEDFLVVQEIFRVLKNEGMAVISVPEDMNLWSKHDEAVNHFRRYSKAQLVELFMSQRFLVTNNWSVNRYLKPLLKVYRRRLKGSDLKRLPKPLNFLLYAIANFDYKTKYILNSGVSIWLIVEKNI
jgi:SAM-dependent methyltransferase